MYDETTVIVPIGMTSEDYFLVLQLARKKNMTRSQFILDCVRQAVLKEQEAWKAAPQENKEEMEEDNKKPKR